ncbi:MAG TPA: hypothetical protein VGK74_15215 [Symbiobacteriaceae bacterium]|jgi:DNA-binding MarR family transcriptional regulator
MTGVADRLERDGWLVRERTREDRRVVHIRLKEKAQSVTAIRRALDADLAQVAGTCSPDEALVLQQALERLHGQLRPDIENPSGSPAA